MSRTTASLPVTGTVVADSAGMMLVLAQRLDGYDTFLTGLLELDGDTSTPVRILTLDDVTVLRLTGTAARTPAGSWSGTLHLPHGQRPRPIPPDLTDAARMSRRDLTALDTAELRYALTFLDEATTDPIRRARIDAIITALPTLGTAS